MEIHLFLYRIPVYPLCPEILLHQSQFRKNIQRQPKLAVVHLRQILHAPEQPIQRNIRLRDPLIDLHQHISCRCNCRIKVLLQCLAAAKLFICTLCGKIFRLFQTTFPIVLDDHRKLRSALKTAQPLC